MAAPRILVAASINVDLVAWADSEPSAGDLVHGTDFVMSLGGKGANVATQVARSGGDVEMLASVGQDMLGDFALAELQRRGVDTSRIHRAATHTGVGHVWVDRAGEYRGIVVAGSNAVPAVDPAALRALAVDSTAAVAQFESAAETLEGLLALAGSGCRVYLNPSPFSRSLAAATTDRCDVLIVNHSEAVRVAAAVGAPLGLSDSSTDAGTVAGLLLEHTTHVAEVVVTLGSEGAVALTRGGEVVRVGTPSVEVVGTIGAGDAFLGEYVVARSRGLDLPEALTRACASGALATTLPQAQADAATREAIDALSSRS